MSQLAAQHHVQYKPSSSKNKKRSSKYGRSNAWHKNTGNAASIYNNGDLSRKRIVTSASGKTYRRTEYKSTAENRNLNNSLTRQNNYQKSRFGRVGKFLMDFNDKYGPKYTTEVEYDVVGEKGKKYVERYTVNIIGRRATSVEAYSYDLAEDQAVRRKVKKSRESSKFRKARKHG